MNPGEDRLTLAVVAALLRQGRIMHALSRAIMVAALIGLVLPALGLYRPPAGAWMLLAAVAGAGLAEMWFAARVSFDAALFQAMARDPAWPALDSALTGLDLMPADKAGRPEAARIAGARRLLGFQAGALIAQLGLVALLALLGVVRW